MEEVWEMDYAVAFEVEAWLEEGQPMEGRQA